MSFENLLKTTLIFERIDRFTTSDRATRGREPSSFYYILRAEILDGTIDVH